MINKYTLLYFLNHKILKMNKFNYEYPDFIQDCETLINLTKDLKNFKWDIFEVNKGGDFLLNSLNLRYLKSNVFVNNMILEFNIIFSEIYQMPTVYFLITDISNNTFIKFEEYINIIKESVDFNSDFIQKNYEISKIVINILINFLEPPI